VRVRGVLWSVRRGTYDGLQAVFLDFVAVRSAQVGHEDDRSGT
jgi:hypothetical protein